MHYELLHYARSSSRERPLLGREMEGLDTGAWLTSGDGSSFLSLVVTGDRTTSNVASITGVEEDPGFA